MEQDSDYLNAVQLLEIFWKNYTETNNRNRLERFEKDNWLQLFLFQLLNAHQHERELFERNCLKISIVEELSIIVFGKLDEFLKNLHVRTLSNKLNGGGIVKYSSKVTQPKPSSSSSSNDLEKERKSVNANMVNYLPQTENEAVTLNALYQYLLKGVGGKILFLIQDVGGINNLPSCNEFAIILFRILTLIKSDGPDYTKCILSYNYKNEDLLNIIRDIKIYSISAKNKIKNKSNQSTQSRSMECGKKTPRKDDENIAAAREKIKQIILKEVEDYRIFVTEEYISYRRSKMTFAQFNVTVLSLLKSTMLSDKINTIDPGSLTFQCLNYSTEKYWEYTKDSDILKIENNRDFIRLLYLELCCICLKIIYATRICFKQKIDLRPIFQKLLKALKYETDHNYDQVIDCGKPLSCKRSKNVYGCCYILLIILNNSFFNDLLHDLKSTNCHEIFTNFSRHYNIFSNAYQMVRCDIEDCESSTNNNFHYKSLMDLLLTIYRNFKQKEIKRYKKIRSFKVQQSNNTFRFLPSHHSSQMSWQKKIICQLESLLLQIGLYANYSRQATILNYLHKYGMCCCNCNKEMTDILIEMAQKNNKLTQKSLNLIRNQIIYLLFRPSECIMCVDKMRANIEKDVFLRIYKNALKTLPERYVLVHLLNMPKFIPTVIKSKIIFDIIWPYFMAKKQNLKSKLNISHHMSEEAKLKRSTSESDNDIFINSISMKINDKNGIIDEIEVPQQVHIDNLIYCLKIICTYVKNKSLINAFMEYGILEQLADLFFVPGLTLYICAIYIIAFENVDQLGVSSNTEIVVSNDYMKMILSNSKYVSQILMIYMNELIEKNNNNNNEDNGKLLEIFESNMIALKYNPVCKLLIDKSITIYDLITMNVVFWNTLWQLMQSKDIIKIDTPQFFYSPEQIIILIKSTLTLTLESNDPIDSMAVSESELPDFNGFIILSQDEIDIAASLLSLIPWEATNKDYEDDVLICDNYDDIISIASFGYGCDYVAISEFYFPLKKILKCYGLKPIFATKCDLNYEQVIKSLDFMDFEDMIKNQFQYFNNSNEDLKLFFNIKCLRFSKQKQNYKKRLRYVDIFDSEKMENFEEFTSNISNENQPSVLERQHSSSSGILQTLKQSTKKLNDFLVNNIFGIIIPHSPKTPPIDIDSREEIIRKMFKSISLTKEQHNVDEKRKIAHIFEAALRILMLNYSEHQFESRVLPALIEIKKILLAHSLEHSNSVDSARSIVRALETILKVTEIKTSQLFHQRSSTAVNLSNTSPESEDLQFLSPSQSIDNDIFRSDLDQSDDEDLNYLTAEDDEDKEGYEADCEQLHLNWLESDPEPSWWTRASNESLSGLGNLVVHKSICKIIMEILFDLSKKCLDYPNVWSCLLMSIVNRLVSMRHILGGSAFILKGFTSILESNDSRLKELQKSILDLITDINTPDSLKTFLQILTAENPPIQILLPKLAYVVKKQAEIQALVAVDFPTIQDNVILSQCDPLICKNIGIISEYHTKGKMETAFTRSTVIVPLNVIDFKPWSIYGFTLAAWIRIKETSTVDKMDHENSLNSTENICNIQERTNENLATDQNYKLLGHILDKTHLFSIGTNKILFSVHVDNNNTNIIYIQLIRPNVAIPKSNISNMTTLKPTVTKNLIEMPNVHGPYINENVEDQNVNSNNHSSSTGMRNVFSTALKTNFSFTNLMSRSNGKKSDEFNFFITKLPIPVDVQLQKGKWTHMAFSVAPTAENIIVIITVNGSEQFHIIVPYGDALKVARNANISVLCIGDTEQRPLNIPDLNIPASSTKTISPDKTETIERVKYSLSNVLLFQQSIPERHILANLVALGPDCNNIINCQIGNPIPNFGLIDHQNYKDGLNFEVNQSLKILKEQLIVSYSAHCPNYAVEYITSYDENLGNPLGIVITGQQLKSQQEPSIYSSVLLCGGLSCMLYLLARTVELTDCPYLQSTALDILLNVAHKNVNLYTEFVKMDYINLIGTILRTNKCKKGIHMLRPYLDIAFDGPIVKRESNNSFTIINSNRCLIYPDLIISVINNFKDWRDGDTSCGDILEFLFEILTTLNTTLTKELNVQQLTSVGFVPNLINFCKIYLIGVSPPISITPKAAILLIDLVSDYGRSPPTASLIDEIAKLLLQLHEPSDVYITQDRGNYYYLLSATSPSKPKLKQIAETAERFKQSFKFKEKKRSSILQNEGTPIRRSVSVDRLWKNRQSLYYKTGDNGEIKKSNDEKLQSDSKERDNLLDTLTKIADCSKVNNRIGNLVKKDVAKLGRTIHNVQALKNRRTLQKSNYQRHVHYMKKIESTHEKRRQIRISTFLNDKSHNLIHSHGVVTLQREFLKLVQNFIVILPDNTIDEVLNYYVTINLVLILANNPDCEIRAEVVNLFSKMCDRLPMEKINQYAKSYIFNHMANQISIYSANVRLAMACQNWFTGGLINFNDYTIMVNSLSDQLKRKQKFGLILMIGILPQLVDSHENTLNASLQLLYKIYNMYNDTRLFMSENGLVPAMVKCLSKLYLKNPHLKQTKGIGFTLTIWFYYLAKKAFLSSNNIQQLWDLLNSLVHIEITTESLAVYQGMRNVQAQILNGLLWLCIHKQTSTRAFLFKTKIKANIQIKKSPLSDSDQKTRFTALMDRCMNFLQAKDSKYEPQNTEIRLVQSIVRLGLTGRVKIGSIIIWSLCPARSVDLKIFIIHFLSALMKVRHMATFGFNTAFIKTLTQNFLAAVNSNPRLLSPKMFDVLIKFSLLLNESNNRILNVQKILDKVDNISRDILKEEKSNVEKTVHKFEHIAISCTETSLKVTRDLSELQNTERKNLLNQMRSEKQSNFNWKAFVSRMTHENALFFNRRYYPNSWEMDDTEGPSRVRVRLKRCHLNLSSKFLLPESHEKMELLSPDPPLNYLLTSLTKIKSSFLDQVLYSFPALYITLGYQINGDLVITETAVTFFPDSDSKEPIIMEICNIAEIWLRRYQHIEKAIEIFLTSGRSIFIVLNEMNDRKTLERYFVDKIYDFANSKCLNILVQQWRDGQLSNWEYLTVLNQISGRTYQDVMQYPVFPWILSDYQNTVLDLNNVNSYRNFSKPIAIQHESNESYFIKLYDYLAQSEIKNHSYFPYYYSSLYSNPGIILHFLVRVPPYTSMFIKYQDNNFDMPDRTFHAIRTLWNLASRDSQTDVKELIPEFFCLPEFLENNEGFNFGIRQSGDRVNHVLLPPWSNNSSRLFILIHRQALESDIVRHRINNWIDLIFGYKRSGTAAIQAMNVYHSSIYPEYHEPPMSDPMERHAYQVMTESYGQMPKQLFNSPHQMTAISQYCYGNPLPFTASTVKGLKWGIYTGSPQLPDPQLIDLYQQFDIPLNKLLCLENTNTVYGLAERCNYMQGIEVDTMYIISWYYKDNIVRINNINDEKFPSKPLFQNSVLDPISCCGTNIYSNQLWFGHNSGRVMVYQCCDFNNEKQNRSRYSLQYAPLANTLTYNSAYRMIKTSGKINENSTNKYRDVGNLKWKKPIELIFHEDMVVDIKICVDFKIAVSICKHGKAAIWDINSLEYVRQIPPPNSLSTLPISLLAISSTLGDIITIHHNENAIATDVNSNSDLEEESYEVTESNIDDFVRISMNFSGKSLMRLHTINAKYVNHITLQEQILSVCYSSVKEGSGINVIATGFKNGNIKLWSSWDLNFVREINTRMSDVIDLGFSTYQHLIILTKDNCVQVWQSPGLLGNPPKFPQIIFKK